VKAKGAFYSICSIPSFQQYLAVPVLAVHEEEEMGDKEPKLKAKS
jgi:hypothetical protein